LDLACGRDERVLASNHRRRSGMPRTSLEDELSAGIPDDSGHDSDRHVSFGQNGSLLDMELEERPRKLPAGRNARAASDASDFLPAKDTTSQFRLADSLNCRRLTPGGLGRPPWGARGEPTQQVSDAVSTAPGRRRIQEVP
jgi:hypothetical protein